MAKTSIYDDLDNAEFSSPAPKRARCLSDEPELEPESKQEYESGQESVNSEDEGEPGLWLTHQLCLQKRQQGHLRDSITSKMIQMQCESVIFVLLLTPCSARVSPYPRHILDSALDSSDVIVHETSCPFC